MSTGPYVRPRPPWSSSSREPTLSDECLTAGSGRGQRDRSVEPGLLGAAQLPLSVGRLPGRVEQVDDLALRPAGGVVPVRSSRTVITRMCGPGHQRRGRSGSSRSACQTRSRVRWTSCDRTVAGPPAASTTEPTRHAPTIGRSASRRRSYAVTARVPLAVATLNHAPCTQPALTTSTACSSSARYGVQLGEADRQRVEVLEPAPLGPPLAAARSSRCVERGDDGAHGTTPRRRNGRPDPTVTPAA